MPRIKFSFDEHVSVGTALHETHKQLSDLATALGRAYTLTTPANSKVGNTIASLDRLRSALDSQLCKDHPDMFDPAVYYPGALERHNPKLLADIRAGKNPRAVQFGQIAQKTVGK